MKTILIFIGAKCAVSKITQLTHSVINNLNVDQLEYEETQFAHFHID